MASLPAVLQDADSEAVLMLGFMDREALAVTLRTGRAASTGRQRLWTKGETSGNVAEVVSISVDCDRDTLLLRVRVGGDGRICHRYGVLFHRVDRLAELLAGCPSDEAAAGRRPEGSSLQDLLFFSSLRGLGRRLHERSLVCRRHERSRDRVPAHTGPGDGALRRPRRARRRADRTGLGRRKWSRRGHRLRPGLRQAESRRGALVLAGPEDSPYGTAADLPAAPSPQSWST